MSQSPPNLLISNPTTKPNPLRPSRLRAIASIFTPMPIREDQLNGRIATLIDRMSPHWRALGENKGAFRGSMRQPDALIISDAGGRPVVIENEYAPAHTVEAEALDRLGETLDVETAGASGAVTAAVALRSPDFLRNLPGADAVDRALADGATLEYALFSGRDKTDRARFPKTGFIAGDIRDLAAFIARAAAPDDAVKRAADILAHGVQDAADILRAAAERAEDTQAEIVRHLKQPYGEQTLRMAATIMINALVFHQNLAGQRGIRNLDQIAPDGNIVPSELLAEWRKILNINYWSIFSVAGDLLRSVNPPRAAVRALGVMRRTADALIALGVSQSGDLAGAVFQQLIADRKFLATFYTRPESATLLAHLAMPDAPDDDQWKDPRRVRNFRIADYACGTGTLIHAAYRRLNQLHWLAGGDPRALHAHMMEHSLTAFDVLPASVHLTASTLSSTHPNERYGNTQTIVAEYGRTERGGVSLGSLDLLAAGGVVRPLIPMHAATEITATGESETWLDMPPASQNLVIMNPPFTRSGSDWDGQKGKTYQTKQFHGLESDKDTQREMAAREKEYTKGTCAHGYAGIGSSFAALAHRMVKKGGTVALILPLTSLQGSSWSKFRKMIAERYRDVTVMTIAASKSHDQSFSADTGMAETMIVFRESAAAPSKRGLFISLKKRPENEMEAIETARAIKRSFPQTESQRTLEGGPFGGDPLFVGDEILGEAINAQIGDSQWEAVSILDFSVAQSAYQLARGRLWLPRMQERDALDIAMTSVGQIARIGISHKDIVGSGARTAFTRIKPPSANATYPMLWNHNAKLETRMTVAPDSEGRVKRGRESRAEEIWNTRSHAHHNADFRFNSQPLTVAYTEEETIGGSAWPNMKFDDPNQEIAHTLWSNTSLGILCYWYHSSRQQVGRGRMPVTALRTMPTLDVRKLTRTQLQAAERIFADMRDTAFLPANESYRDPARRELDERVLTEILTLPPALVAEPLTLLRQKWCSEPSVHGGKKTAPQ